MTFQLNSHNVFDYLTELGLCKKSEQTLSKVKPVTAKNFNLLLTFPDSRKLLVKQERYNRKGNTTGEFLREWKFQEFLQEFPELSYLRPFVSEVLYFDKSNSIIIFNYLDNYRDLMDFYMKENSFPKKIASSIGTLIGTIHRSTFNRQDYQNFFSQKSEDATAKQMTKLIQGFERIEPDIFGKVSSDELKFLALYQRYDSLGQAIAQLGSIFTPCCLTHNDLKLNNILLETDWENKSDKILRLIDWERSSWGDPAFDLGTLIASYLQIWLSSMIVSKSLTIQESLRLATIPLEEVQLSITFLTNSYFHNFPEILEHRPDFLIQVLQFTGFALIQQIQPMIQYQKSFGNTGITMLQVAKSLLCRPQQSMQTIFGAATELTQVNTSAV